VKNDGTVETKAVVAELEKQSGVPTVAGPRGFTHDLHIQNKARYLIIGWHQGELKVEGYWSTGPIPLDVLMKN
jgi:branched-chain amino acid transport system substrate-binding protein